MTAVGREAEREASAHTEQRRAAIFSVKEAESMSVGSGYNILLPFIPDFATQKKSQEDVCFYKKKRQK